MTRYRASFLRTQALGVVTLCLCLNSSGHAATQVVAWGNNYYNASSLVLTDLTDVVEIDGSPAGSFGLRSDGTLVGRPVYESAPVTLPVGLSNVVAFDFSPISGEARGFSLALRSDGTAISLGYYGSWYGYDYNTPVPTGLSNLVAVAAGFYHAIALKSDGTVAAWGYYSGSGQTNVPATLSNVVAISASAYYNLALKSDGRVVAWGDGGSATNVPSGLSNVVAIAAGFYHGLALKSDGKLAAWGSGPYGELNIPSGLSNVVAIATDGSYDLALRSDGKVFAWGYNGYHNAAVPVSLSNVVAIAAGKYALALVGDGPPRSPALLINLAVAYGTPLFLPASTSGSLVQRYIWNFNGTELPGVTNNTLILNSLAFSNSGSYSVILSNQFGTVTNSYTVSVVPVLITLPPKSQTVYGGSTVSFGVSATGVNLRYQWQFNGTDVIGATNATLTLTNVLPEQTGSYSVTVSNSVGAAVSAPATLVVNALGLTAQPADQTVFGGDNVTLNVAAAGVLPIDYQWRFNGIAINGETNSSLALTQVLPDRGGVYSVVVSNRYTTVTSVDATLTVIALGITSQPQNQSILAGSSVTFTVDAAGVPPIVFQWRFNGTNLIGQTNKSLSIAGAQTSQSGNYSVLASNVYTTVTSSDAVLTVSPSWFTTPPQSQTVFKGGAVNLSVVATSNIPFQLQWLFNGTRVLGATNAVLSMMNLQYSQTGAYSVVASNAYGSTTSDSAAVSVVNFALGGGWTYPVFPTPTSNVVAIAAGWSHFIILKADGTIFLWGSNGNGQLDAPATLSSVITLAANSIHSMALKSDGSVVPWQSFNYYGMNDVPASLTNTVAISTGFIHNLALKADGIVVAWGDTSEGATLVPMGLTNVVAIAAGYYHSLALTESGALVAWGANGYPYYGQTLIPVDLTNVVAIAAGDYHNLALRVDGTVAAWGRNDSGQCNVPANLSKVVAIAAGASSSLALKGDGTIATWGTNPGLPPGLTNVQAIIPVGAIIGDAPPISSTRVVNLGMTSSGFACGIVSQCGRVYRLEYVTSPGATDWHPLPLVAGNSGMLRLIDPSATNGTQRFYRVRRW